MFFDKPAVKDHDHINCSIADAAYTLQMRRMAMEERIAVIASDINELIQKLKAHYEGKKMDIKFF